LNTITLVLSVFLHTFSNTLCKISYYNNNIFFFGIAYLYPRFQISDEQKSLSFPESMILHSAIENIGQLNI